MSLRQAIQAFNIEAYLDGHGCDWVKHDERSLGCPSCGKALLIVNLNKKAWHCWYCEGKDTDQGKGGLLDLIQLLDQVTRDQARSRVLHGFHGAVGLETVEDLKHDYQEMVEHAMEIKPPALWRLVDSNGIMPYCEKRGISSWESQQFRLMWCPGGQYGGRLIFPVWERDKLVYWQARAMWEKHEHPVGLGKYIKSLNPPKLRGACGSGDVLFNLDRARLYPSVMITEGPIDAIHAGPDAVCTFGKRLMPAQVGKLLRAGVRRIELMWDGPGPTEPMGAWPEMFEVAERLKGLFDIRLIFLPRGDPGDYTHHQLCWYRQHSSRPLSSFSRLMEV